MAIGFGSIFAAFWRLNLGSKAVIGAIMLITVNTALVVGAGYWSLARDFDARARRDIDFNLRTLSLAFGEEFQSARIKLRDGIVDRIEMAEIVVAQFASQRFKQITEYRLGREREKFAEQPSAEQIEQQITDKTGEQQPHRRKMPLQRSA